MKLIGDKEIKMSKLIIGINDLATNNPKLTKEWHPTRNSTLKPFDVTSGSNKKIWWLGVCGHEWQAVIKNRSTGVGCPICAGKQVLLGFNDLASLHPTLAAEWHPTKNGALSPYNVTVSSGKKVWWQCSQGHEWEDTIYHRTAGRGCVVCNQPQKQQRRIQSLIKKNGSLASTYPGLATEWHPTKNGDLLPSQVSRGSHQKVWWLSNCGHEWQAVVLDRVRGRGCPVCGRKKKVKRRSCSLAQDVIEERSTL